MRLMNMLKMGRQFQFGTIFSLSSALKEFGDRRRHYQYIVYTYDVHIDIVVLCHKHAFGGTRVHQTLQSQTKK